MKVASAVSIESLVVFVLVGAAAAGASIVSKQLLRGAPPGIAERPGTETKKVRVHVICGKTGEKLLNVKAVRVEDGELTDDRAASDVDSNVVEIPNHWHYRISYGDFLSSNTLALPSGTPADVTIECHFREGRCRISYVPSP